MKGITNMAKKGTKIALTYLITIFLTLLIIGVICYLLMQQILNPSKPAESSVPELDPLIAYNDYTPSAEHNKTTLFIFDSEKRLSGTCFLIVRMLATEQKLMVMPIPADTCANLDGTENSIYEFYRTGGSKKAVSAAEAATGVSFDYYIKLNNESFALLADIFGGFDFNVPYNLIYSNPDTGEDTIIREGDIYLDSNILRKIITYPLYNSGEEYRAKMLGIAAADMINKNVMTGFSSHIDDYFSVVINSQIETNFTAYDYAELSEAMKYTADSSDRIAQLITVTGAYNENSLFVLDENFIKAIPELLRV